MTAEALLNAAILLKTVFFREVNPGEGSATLLNSYFCFLGLPDFWEARRNRIEALATSRKRLAKTEAALCRQIVLSDSGVGSCEVICCWYVFQIAFWKLNVGGRVLGWRTGATKSSIWIGRRSEARSSIVVTYSTFIHEWNWGKQNNWGRTTPKVPRCEVASQSYRLLPKLESAVRLWPCQRAAQQKNGPSVKNGSRGRTTGKFFQAILATFEQGGDNTTTFRPLNVVLLTVPSQALR